MKLYNKTKYPDSLLEPLLTQAGISVGARTTNVIVKVTQCKSGRHNTHGIAQRAGWVYKWTLDSRAYTKQGKLKEQAIETDGGWIRLTIPHPYLPVWLSSFTPTQKQHFIECHSLDGLSIAESIYEIACHEWQHINQYQTGKYNHEDKRERAKNHDNRIWEKDADRATKRVMSKPKNKSQESILNMALWIESINKKDGE